MVHPVEFLQNWHDDASNCHKSLRVAIRAGEYKDKITDSLIAAKEILKLLDKLKEYLKDIIRNNSEEIRIVFDEVGIVADSNREISQAVLVLDILLTGLNERQDRSGNRSGVHKTARQLADEASQLVQRVTEIDDKLEDLLDNIDDLVHRLREGYRSAAMVYRAEVRANVERFRLQRDEEAPNDEAS